jgi:phage repressor protein C with HTH and peptisase S24 domain/DNA-binding XRE family transcriptional regulator
MQRMDTTAERLRHFREEKGISSGAELARLAGVPEATYRAYESGRRPLTARAARELARPLGITWQMLLFGKEQPKGGITVNTPEEAAAVLGQRVHRKPVAPRGYGGPATAEVVSMGGDSWALLPVYDTAASAGPGKDIDREAVVHRIAFREEWIRTVTKASLDQLAVISVDGDSMEPTLRPGDTVLIDFRQNHPADKDGIYVIRTGNGLQVKRVQVELGRPPKIAVLSDNPVYQPQRNLKPDDIHVVGRVIWLGRQVGA